jgi:uncharacterized delta-60 repeat protein
MKRFSLVLKPSSWCLLVGLLFATAEARAQDLNFSRLTASWQNNANATLSGIGNYFRPRGLTTATATATVSSGSVTGFVITNPGGGYAAPPTVTLTGGGGSGAAVVAVLSPTGSVASVTILNGGTGYTSSPTVTFSAPLLGGVGSTGIFNTDITVNPRLLTVDGNYTYGRMILGDLGGGEAYSFELGTGGRFTFDNGIYAGGHAFLNKFQGGADLIKTPLTIRSNLIARVQANRITLSDTISGTGVLTSTGNGLLAITGNNTGTGMNLVLWNRGGGGTGAQVELGSVTGHAVSGDIIIGNTLRGTNGNAVLQLLQGRGNLDQINDASTLIFDSMNGVGRNAYFKLMGGSETVARILDIGDRAVIENREGEGVGTSAILTIGGNTVAGNRDSRINGFLRDASGSNTQQGDSNALNGAGPSAQLGLTKRGTGDLLLAGGNIIYSGNTLVASGSLTLLNTTNFRSNITNNSQLNFDVSGTFNLRKVFPTIPGSNPSKTYPDEYLSVTGTGSIHKTGAGTLGLFGAQNIGGGFTMDNGTLNFNADATGISIGGALTSRGDPGVNRNINLRGVVNIGGGIDLTGRFINTGSSLTIGGAALGRGDQEPATWADTAVNVTGSIRVNHANLILQSDYNIGKTSAGGTTNVNTVTVTNSADLLVGMRVTGTGVPANTTVTGIDPVRRVVTLSTTASIPGSTALTFSFSNNTDGRIIGSPTNITISGRSNLVGAGDSGSRLVLSNTQFSNNTNRIPDATPIVSNGGVMEFINNASGATGANFSETVGNLVLNPGAFQVIGYRAAAGRTSTLTFASLQRNAGGILEFGGRDLSSGAVAFDTNNLGVDTRNRILFSSAPTLSNGILGGWAYINNEWATYGANGINRFSDYNTTSANTDWRGGTLNAKMLAGQTFSSAGERALHSLNIQPAITAGAADLTLNLNTSPLYIASGGLLASHGNHIISATSGFLTAGTSTPGERELFALVGNTNNSTSANILRVSAPIRDFVISRNINLANSGSATVNITNGFTTNELSVGMAVRGPGIASGTTIAGITGNQLTLSQNTIALMTAGTALSFGNTERVSVVKGGAGTLRLESNDNTYTGRTVVANGTLMLGIQGALGAAPSGFVADQVRLDGGFLQFARRTVGTGATTDVTKTGIDNLVPDKIYNFNDGLMGFTIGSSGGRFEVGVNNPNNAPAGATGEPEVHVTITNPIFAEGLLELAVRATPGLGQFNTLTLGDVASTNRYLGGLKTEGSFEGLVSIRGNNEIGGLLVEGGEMAITGNNDFTSGIRLSTGVLTLSGANTFRGSQIFPTLSLPSGTLRLENPAALGTGGLSLALGGGGQVELRGINQTIREISANASTSATVSNAAATPVTLTFALDNNQSYSGTLNNGGLGALNLVKTGPARLQLTNSQSGFSGSTRIQEGVIDVRTMGFSGQISSFGTGGNGAASQLVLAGGVLSFSPVAQLNTNRSFTLGTGPEAGTLVANGSNRTARVIIGAELDALLSQPIAFEGTGPRTLTLGGVNVGLNTLALELGDAGLASPSALMKIGSGTWLLGGASKFSGQTTLVDGVLQIDANDAAGTTSIPTTASAAANTLAGNLPDGVIVSLPKFKGSTLPGGLVAGQRYYVVGSTGSAFQLAATPGGTAIDLTSDGVNVSFVPNIQGVASTSLDNSSGAFSGNLPNGTPVAFGNRAVWDPTGVGGILPQSLPAGVSVNTTYYVVNSTGTSFQIATTPGGPALALTGGANMYYTAAVAGNTSEGIYVLGGRLDIGNVDYTTPETLIFQGGSLGVPRNVEATWAGNVDLQANANWTINAGSTLTMTGNLLGNRTITQLGEGTVVLKGEAITFIAPDAAGNTMDSFRRSYTLQAGTLVLDYSLNNNSKLTDNATLVMGGGRRGGVLRLQNGSHEEIVNNLSLQAGASRIYRDSGSSVIRLNAVSRQTGASLYFDLERIAKVDDPNVNGILGAWAIIRDGRVDSYFVLPGTVSRPFSADPATATLKTPDELPVHYLAAGVPVRFTTTGELPAGLSAGVTYYVVDATSRSFRVSATPFGDALQFSTAGTGVHTVETFGAVRRPGPASLVFTADPRRKAGVAGNDTIKLRIRYTNNSNAISITRFGAGTLIDPWLFTITISNAFNSASQIAAAVTASANSAGYLKVVSSGPEPAASTDYRVSFPADLSYYSLSGGIDDNGSQSLSWARNGSVVAGNFNDGPVESANDLQTNIWGSGFNTDVLSNGSPIEVEAGASTYTLRFANAIASELQLLGGLGHVLQSGSILVSPLVGRNDSTFSGTSTLTTGNQGYLQNFLIHQYNEQGDLVLGVPLVDRGLVSRSGWLSAPLVAGGQKIRLITGLVGLDGTGDTSQLAVGMTVTGTAAPGGATIAQILDSRTVVISADFSSANGDNLRNTYTFGGSIQMRGSIRQNSQNRITGVVNEQGQLSTFDYYVGMPISGPGIPPGYRVQSIVNESDITIGTLNGNGITVDGNNHAYNGMRTDMTFTPSIGLEKLGPGTLVASGNNTYTGLTYLGDGALRATKLTDGGVPGSLGASTNAAGNLTFNGGVLQYIGASSTSNRALTLFDYAEINIGHERTTSVFGGSISGSDVFAKSGSGTLEMRGNAGLAEIRVLEGRLRIQGTDLNNAPATFSLNNFGQTGLGELRLSGGAFELRGTPNGDTNLTLGGQLFVDAGASEVRAVGVNGINPNNLNGGSVPRSTTLSLMGGEELTNVLRSAGGSVLFIEDPLVGGSVANILLNVEELARGRILPWAVYQDTTNIAQAGVNNFAAISLTTGAVVSADSQSQYNIGDGFMNANTWGTGTAADFVNASEGGQVERTLFSGVDSTAGSNVLTVSDFLAFQFDSLVPDMKVFGPGIPSNTKIVSLLTSPRRIVLSQNATSDNTGATYTFRRPRAYFGTLTANRGLNTLRYFSNADSQITVPAGNTLQVLSGAILVSTNVRGGQKSIVGDGSISGAVGSDASDFIIHNYNPVAAFTLGTRVTDNVLRLASAGTLSAGSNSLRVLNSGIPTLRRLRVGMSVSGPGLAPGTTIVSIDDSNNRVLLSSAALSAQTGQTYSFTAATSFVQSGTGTTVLAGNNDYTGSTYVHGGVLRLDSANAVPGGIGAAGGISNLIVKGGVVGLGHGDFNRAGGTGSAQIQFQGSGGFAAYGADRTVNFGGKAVPDILRYGNNGFVPDGSSFLLGARDATHKTLVLNPIDLGSFSQAVRVTDGPASIEAELAGGLIGLGKLIKFGGGSLRLSGSSTHSGGIEVAAGRLIIADVPGVLGVGAGPVALGTDLTNTAKNAAIEMVVEGGTLSKNLQIGNVNSRGADWILRGSVDTSGNQVGSQASTALINNHPAIAYYDSTSGDLKYVRAADPRGTSWLPPVTVASRGDVGQYPSLAIVNGNPAISYYDATNKLLMFVRSTDGSGVFWSNPVIVDSSPVSVIAVQAVGANSGKMIIGGTFVEFDGQVRQRLARINSDGSLDPTFSPRFNGEVLALAVQSDDKILVAGSFTDINGTARNRLVRLEANGSLDASYNPDFNGTIRGLLIEPDNRVLVWGSFTGTNRNRVARLNADGSSDNSFNVNANNEVRAVARQSDGSLVIGGTFTQVGGVDRNRIARVSSTGVLDGTFNPNFNGTVSALLIQPDGKILTGGTFSYINNGGRRRDRLARINSTGTPDESFFLDADAEVRGFLRQADGEILVYGAFTRIGVTPRFNLARLNTDDTLDVGFNPNANDEVLSVVQISSGELLVGGSFSNIGGGTRHFFARLTLDGQGDMTFNRQTLDRGRHSSLAQVRQAAAFNAGEERPAIAYYDVAGGLLRYTRAVDVNGANWNPPLILDASANVGTAISLGMVNVGGDVVTKNNNGTPNNPNDDTVTISGIAINGTPAVAYYDATQGDLKYILANDPAGTDWSASIAVSSSGDVGSSLSLAMVDGRPAIAYHDLGGGLRYVRATSPGGLTSNLRDINGNILTLAVSALAYTGNWAVPVLVDAGQVGAHASLAVITDGTSAQGRPAIAYYDAAAADLKYVRAQDVTGSLWGTPRTVVSNGDVGRNAGLVLTDGVAGIAYRDATAGDVKFLHLADATGYSRITLGDATDWQGNVTVDGDIFFNVGADTAATISGVIQGAAGIKVSGSGTLRLTHAGNNFGATLPGPAATINSAVIIRSGTLALGVNGAIGAATVELGDALPQVITVDRATTFESLTALAGRFDADHNGFFDNAGGPGAFVEVDTTIDGFTYRPETLPVTPVFILVKDERENPQWNGVYQIIFNGDQQPDGTMNLVRIEAMNTAAELAYGTQVRVSNGTQAGRSFFIASQVDEMNASAVNWVRDVADGTAALLAEVAGLNVSNAIDINGNPVASGDASRGLLGGMATLTSGNVQFSGNVLLQNRRTGVREERNVDLQSFTNTGYGVGFNGVFAESDSGTGATQDRLNLRKTGSGVATLSASNTLRGSVTVAEGTLLAMNSAGSATGFGGVTVHAGAVLGGTGFLGGPVNLAGAAGVKAILRPGDPTATALTETLTVNAALTVGTDAVVEFAAGAASLTRLIANSVAVTGTGQLLLTMLDGYVPPVDTVIDLVEGSISLPAGANLRNHLILPGNVQWDTSSFLSDGSIRSLGLTVPVAIATPPAITTPAAGGPVNPGGNVTVTFTATVSGSAGFRYQWQRSPVGMNTWSNVGAPIFTSATTATLTLTGILEADEADYRLVAANGSLVNEDANTFTVTSAPVTLAVNDPPTITEQPASVTVNPGETATVSVTATGPGPIFYQWRRGTTNLTPPTEGLSSFQILNVQKAQQGGNYNVLVSNGASVIAGPTQSAFFSLTVRDPVVISNFPATTGVAEGDPIVLNLGHGGSGTPDLPNLGTPAFTYTWERNDGSGFAPIAGAPNAAQITLPAAAPADNGVVIRVTVANSFSSAQAATTIAVVNPSVRTQPQSRTVLAGTAFSLEVEAGGSPEGRTFQWKRGKTNLREGAGITGVTTSVLQIANVDLAQAGDYSCEIRNAFGVRLSDPAFVTVVGVPGTMVPVQIGRNVTLTLPFSAPKGVQVELKWQKDGADLPVDLRYTADNLAKFTVNRTTADDSGIYTCLVTSRGPAPTFRESAAGGAFDVRVFSEAPQLALQPFPPAMVGAPFSYQIQVDPNPARAPTVFSARPLPAGLTLDSRTGRISGIPRAPVESLPVVIGAGNAYAKLVSETLPLTVQAVPAQAVGVFAGWIPRHSQVNESMGGRIDFTVTTAGALSGRLVLGAASYSFKGALQLDPTGANLPNVTLTIPRTGRPTPPPITLFLRINTSLNRLEEGTVAMDGEELDFGATTWRNSWHAVSNPAVSSLEGYHTLALLPPGYPDPAAEIPQGSGYAAFTVAADGRLTLSGRTGDGQTMVNSAFLGPNGEIVVFQPLYKTKPRGSLLGHLTLDRNLPSELSDNQVGGTLSWNCPPNPVKNFLYPDGFGNDGGPAVEVIAVGGQFTPPAAASEADPTPNVIFGIAPGSNNAQLTFIHGGVEDSETNPNLDGPLSDPSTGLRGWVSVQAGSRTLVPTGLEANPGSTSLSFAARTGIFSGKFTLLDFNTTTLKLEKRTSSFIGILAEWDNGALGTAQVGTGHFLLRQHPNDYPPVPPLTLSTTPIRSGEVFFEARPIP